MFLDGRSADIVEVDIQCFAHNRDSEAAGGFEQVFAFAFGAIEEPEEDGVVNFANAERVCDC
jgi:hypothetical protein